MPSLPDDGVRVGALLRTAFTEWRDSVNRLRALANQQLEAIALYPDGPPLDAILQTKARAYEAADAAARNALALREHGSDEKWGETEEIRDEIEIALDDLSRVEAKSSELLGQRAQALQRELEKVQHGRSAVNVYAGISDVAPRFLDKVQ
jgi:hypothetical protein